MLWRERIKQEILAIFEEHEVHWPELATEIAEALPSPDERNGYVIVPVEPTDAMRWAGGSALHDNGADSEGIYKAMIAEANT